MGKVAGYVLLFVGIGVLFLAIAGFVVAQAFGSDPTPIIVLFLVTAIILIIVGSVLLHDAYSI